VSDPWTFTGQPTVIEQGGSAVTLIDESTFVISDHAGNIVPGGAHGLFVRDTRVLSRLELLVDGQHPEALSTVTEHPFTGVFVSRCAPSDGRHDSTLMVFRTRYVGRGLREDVVVRNFGDEPTVCRVEIFVDSDFADLFAVKEGRGADPGGERSYRVDDATLTIEYRRGPVQRGCAVALSPPPTSLADNLVTYEAVVAPKGQWAACLEVAPVIDTSVVAPRYRCGQPVEHAAPSERLARWRHQVPRIELDDGGWQHVCEQSAEDLGALRIFDPDFPDRAVIAAGAPWFMTVFGRDSILSSWMALLLDPDLALGVLQTLARFQGTKVDPVSEEEPGRILHEMRFGEASSLSLGGGSIYYGTVDATPLFVMLLGELYRWGADRPALDALLPHADRALAWMEQFGDRDGDGYIEYQRTSDRGLANQGWKDSWDGVRYADGRVATAPIALCEVQGYQYGAYLARADIARAVGDDMTEQRCRTKAADLKIRFNQDFWLPDSGWFAMGLDPAKKPIDALASNMGHCLWTGIVDEDKAGPVADRLVSAQMFGGWGVRTLATSMTGYNPISYHCGSVWPHDTAIVASGMARYGAIQPALQLVRSLFDAAVALGGRLPELYSGLAKDELSIPVQYPTSCSPQAWASAAPLLCIRTILQLDPDVPSGTIRLTPTLPEGIHQLHIRGVPLAGARVDISLADGATDVSGLPPGVTVVDRPRSASD